MITPEQLFADRADELRLPAPPMDALREENALQEAALAAVRFEPVFALAALLFDLRGALQYPDDNLAVIVAQPVTNLTWQGEAVGAKLSWHTVIESFPLREDRGFSFGLALLSDADLSLDAERAWFVVGSAPELDAPLPDLLKALPSEIAMGIPRWDLPFEPRCSTRISGERWTLAWEK